MSNRRARSGIRVTGLQAGVVMALAAVIAGSFFEVRPPEAYGICMSCHGRDLVNWLSNDFFGTDLTVAQASAVFPVLTTVGVLIGGFIGAVSSGEFRFRMPSRPLKSFGQGLLVMNLALLAGGCSTRLLLSTAAGDLLGLTGFGAMVVGVILATFWIRRRALR
jgi:hypothetical protein